MKVLLAADHAGFEMKEDIKSWLISKRYALEDLGALTFTPTDDYPLFMKKAARRVASSSDAVALLFGKSGQGEAMVANRFHGVRAIVYPAADLAIIRYGRQHNDANVLSIGAGFLSFSEAKEATELFLQTPFSGEPRHLRRLTQIDEMV